MKTITPDHYDSFEAARRDAREALLPVENSVSDKGWDTVVAVMRIILPIAAVIVGGLTIFWPLVNTNEVSFTLSTEDVSQSDGKVHMTKMRYVGTDAIDRLFVLTAAKGVQDNPDAPRVTLTDIRAEMNLSNALENIKSIPASVIARSGIYRIKANSLSLIGGVHVDSGNGYNLNMSGADIDLKAKHAIGHGSIHGQTPLGTITAGGMELSVSDEIGIFSGGVQFKITPKRQ